MIFGTSDQLDQIEMQSFDLWIDSNSVLVEVESINSYYMYNVQRMLKMPIVVISYRCIVFNFFFLFINIIILMSRDVRNQFRSRSQH
jgi:hypothetical protein